MKWHLPTSSSHLVRHWYSFIDSPSAFILSLLLCLCICMLFICMVQCWSFALISYCWCVTQMHTSFFPRPHCLSRHIRWSCTAPSEGHVWYLPAPLFLFSLLLLSIPLSRSLTLNSIISGEGQSVAWRSLSFSSVKSFLLGQFCGSRQNDSTLFHSWSKDHQIPGHHQHVLH